MIRVRLIPLDANREIFGPFDCEQFDIPLGSLGPVFRARSANGSFLDLTLPSGIYSLQCETVTSDAA